MAGINECDSGIKIECVWKIRYYRQKMAKA